MELVINIPDFAYDEIIKLSKKGKVFNLVEAVAIGIPLPKGHGELIDRGALPMEVQSLYDIRLAPTIIEADENTDNTKTKTIEGMEIMHQTLGKRLEYALNSKGIKQCDFADKIGITEVTLSRYINGTRMPRADNIVLICRSLGISSDWLLGISSV